MNSRFWLYDPSILLKKDKMFNFLPKDNTSLANKLNAVTRTVIVLTTLGYLSTKSINMIVSGIVTLIVIVALYKTKNKESKVDLKEGLANLNIEKLASTLTKPNIDNPYMNFMMNDYVDNPDKKPSLPLFNEKVKKMVDESVIKNVDPRLFKDLGDSMNFDAFSRNFHTMPNSTNPNDQKAFAEFCYGGMTSCKDKQEDCYKLMTACKENNYLCKGAYKEGKEGKEKDDEK